jgi:hypothetical protein
MDKWGQIVEPMVPTATVTVIKCMQNIHFRNLEVIPESWARDGEGFNGDRNRYKTKGAAVSVGQVLAVCGTCEITGKPLETNRKLCYWTTSVT